MNEKMTVSIEFSAFFFSGSSSEYYFIRHIFNALTEHRELLEDPQYKRLYDEAIDYLFRRAVKNCGWDENRREWGYAWLEFLAGLENDDDEKTGDKYSIETVNSFLVERQRVWNKAGL